jgi:hypothetical protein
VKDADQWKVVGPFTRTVQLLLMLLIYDNDASCSWLSLRAAIG